jgi:hypothetical protein
MEAEAATIWAALEATALASFVRESTWAYPLLETVHMVGLGLLFGGIFALDIRLLGVGGALPVSHLARHLLPWVWTGFALNVTSGALLFASDAAEFAANTSFRIKMAAIVLAGLNALAFQTRVYPSAMEWDSDRLPPVAARALAALSIALWVAVIGAGRMMAYLK